MPKERHLLVTHTFKGGRFEDHGIDLDVLPELLAYKALLVETAKELWRRNHPDRERLPRNFEESLLLRFYRVEPGSAAIPIERLVEREPLLFSPTPDELDKAVLLVADAEEAAAQDRPLPQDFSKRIIPLFGNYGRTLQHDEWIEQQPAGRPSPVRYSAAVRDRLLRWAEPSYEDTVDLTGEVRAADLDGANFTLRLSNGRKIPGRFTPQQESAITEALREHETRRLHVTGRAEFGQPDHKMKQIISVETFELQNVGEARYDPTARPIWEIVAEIGATVPDQEWEKVPSDLAKNFHHYLYGAPKESE